MADLEEQKKNAKSLAETLKDIGETGAEAASIFNDIGANLGKMAANSKEFSGMLKLSKTSQTNLARDAKVLAGITKEDLKDKKIANDLSKKAQTLAKDITSVNNQRAIIADLLNNATQEEREE